MSRWTRRDGGPAAGPAAPAHQITPEPLDVDPELHPAPPQQQQQPAVRVPAQAPAWPAPSGPVRVVLVDDDRLLAEHLRDLLVDLGAQVLSVAQGGDQALAVARLLTPDVVLTDLRMPGMDGIELTRLLRALPKPPEVVVLSAYEDASLQTEALDAGAASYLVKGSTGTTVLAALHAATRRVPC